MLKDKLFYISVSKDVVRQLKSEDTWFYVDDMKQILKNHVSKIKGNFEKPRE